MVLCLERVPEGIWMVLGRAHGADRADGADGQTWLHLAR